MPFISLPSAGQSDVHGDNILQFRLNTKWFPWTPIAIEASGRTQLYSGQDFRDAKDIAAQLKNDPEYFDMSWAQGSGKTSSVLYENIDRLSAEFSQSNFSATVGRQRVNWGTNLVWNPNDWFNAFNYLDFSYPEHAGSDALRLQYYPTSTSIAEFAATPGRTQSDRTIAALYRLNKWSYDWQFQTGLSGNDAAAGFSWSGAIKGAGFRGEIAWYDPVIDRKAPDKQTIVASISGDYTFPSSLYFQLSGLYNGYGSQGNNGIPVTTLSSVTAKSLLPAKYALFGETAYQINPLVRLDFAGIESPGDGSFCALPSVAVSVLNNIDLNVLMQIFHGRNGSLFASAPDIATMSLKWSF